MRQGKEAWIATADIETRTISTEFARIETLCAGTAYLSRPVKGSEGPENAIDAYRLRETRAEALRQLEADTTRRITRLRVRIKALEDESTVLAELAARAGEMAASR